MWDPRCFSTAVSVSVSSLPTPLSPSSAALDKSSRLSETSQNPDVHAWNQHRQGDRFYSMIQMRAMFWHLHSQSSCCRSSLSWCACEMSKACSICWLLFWKGHQLGMAYSATHHDHTPMPYLGQASAHECKEQLSNSIKKLGKHNQT